MKCYAVFTSGRELEIDEGTYNELTTRINNGRTKGWYKVKHGMSMGCTLNIETLASVEMILTDKERKAIEAKEEAARKARESMIANEQAFTGKRMIGSFTHDPLTCPINHNKIGKDLEPNIDVRYYMTDQDIKHYVPTCSMCGWIGQIVKPASLERTYGIKPEEVEPLIKED